MPKTSDSIQLYKQSSNECGLLTQHYGGSLCCWRLIHVHTL